MSRAVTCLLGVCLLTSTAFTDLGCASDSQSKSTGSGDANTQDTNKAISEKRVINGMTVAQAEKALSVTFRKRHEDSDTKTYDVYEAIANWKQAPIGNAGGLITGGDITGTQYTLEVQGGIIVHWNSRPYHEDPGTAHTGR